MGHCYNDRIPTCTAEDYETNLNHFIAKLEELKQKHGGDIEIYGDNLMTTAFGAVRQGVSVNFVELKEMTKREHFQKRMTSFSDGTGSGKFVIHIC